LGTRETPIHHQNRGATCSDWSFFFSLSWPFGNSIPSFCEIDTEILRVPMEFGISRVHTTNLKWKHKGVESLAQDIPLQHSQKSGNPRKDARPGKNGLADPVWKNK